MYTVHCTLYTVQYTVRWRFPSIWLAKLQILVRKKLQKKGHDTCLHCSLSFPCDNPSLCCVSLGSTGLGVFMGKLRVSQSCLLQYLTKVNILVLKKSKDKANKKVYVAQMKNVAKLHILS